MLWLETFWLLFQLSLERQAEIPEHSALHSCLFSSFNEAITFGESPLFLASALSASLSTFDYCFTVLQIPFIISVPTRFTLSGVHFYGKKKQNQSTKKPHPPTLGVIATYSALAHRVCKLHCPQMNLNELCSKTIFNMSQLVGLVWG